MLEGFKTLPELLAARPADFSPPGFWELFESETHATQSGSCGQRTEAVQVRRAGGEGRGPVAAAGGGKNKWSLWLPSK